MNILGISGSLRADSSNTGLVRAAALLAPSPMEFTLYDGLGSLPHYSPELDHDDPPESVQALRRQLRAADGVFVCTPEYAHGMPGSLKNALDWLVSSGEFDGGKPTAALSASPSFLGGDKAHAWLVQILTVLGAWIPEGGSLIVPFVRTKVTAEGEVSDPELRESLIVVLQALAKAIESRVPHAQ